MLWAVVLMACYSKFELTDRPRFAVLGNLNPGIGILAKFIPQCTDRNAQDVGGVRAVAEAMIERIEDEIALDIGDRASDEGARGLRGRCGGKRCWIGAFGRAMALSAFGHLGAIGQADG